MAKQKLPPHLDFFSRKKKWPKCVFVTHERPDTDAYLCLWLMIRRYCDHASEWKIELVRSGEGLNSEEKERYAREGYLVIEADTGGGPNDQHGKELKGASSFMLLMHNLGYGEEPVLTPFVELANASDSVRHLDGMSVHYYFKCLPAFMKDSEGDVDFGSICTRVFEILDVLFSYHKTRADSAAQFARTNTVEKLGRITFCQLTAARFRDAAFEAGVDVVLWLQDQQTGGFYVGVQTNRYASLDLSPVVTELRRREAEREGRSLNGADLAQVGKLASLSADWYFHDSRNFIACGTHSHPLEPHERTKLAKNEIGESVRSALLVMGS